MNNTELLIAGILVAVSMFLIAYSLLPSRRNEKDTMLRRMAGKRGTDEQAAILAQARDSATKKVIDSVAKKAMRPVMPRSDEAMNNLKTKLARAGYRREGTSTLFLGSKTVLGGGLAVLAALAGWSGGHAPLTLFGIAVGAAGVGFLLPDVWLALAVKQRTDKIRNGLPDSLDLLVVSVEAGLGLDAAFQRVADELRDVYPNLSEEYIIAVMENQMGVPRMEALANMARRVGIPELTALVAIISQAEKFGTSVAKALRNQAAAIRIKRRQKAEERAQKTAVKLMMPLILFIFPAMFVVLVGPAAIRLIRTLSSNPALSG